MATQFAAHAEFLKYCLLQVAISPAAEADVPRLTELAQRTHQLNSGHTPSDAQAFTSLLRDPEHKVVTVRSGDRFGDDGIVGGIVIRDRIIRREVPLIMMSCRAIGRSIIDVLLTWLLRDADGSRIKEVIIPCRVHASNVSLRIALVSAGFTASTKRLEGRMAHYTRSIYSPIPEFPEWAHVSEELT